MFRSATFRLTVWYLAALALLSFVFSILLYRSLTSELGNGLQNQVVFIRDRQPQQPQPRLQEFLDQREKQIRESKDRILWQLVYFNLLIVATGGLGSYWLARRTLKPIEDAHEAQVRFTSDASHELRTPLAAMKAELEVGLRDKGLTLMESKNLHVSSLQELAKLEALTSGLLKLAVHDDNRKNYYSITPLRQVVEEAIARVQSAAKAKNITLELEAGEGTAYGDQWALVELGAILLDNAVKYTQAGGLVALVVGSVPGYSLITVKDNGIGIPSSNLPFIFNRFYRSDSARAKVTAEGYGLGLSIAKKIVDAHGGSLTVSSALGKGTSFEARIPSKARARGLHLS